MTDIWVDAVLQMFTAYEHHPEEVVSCKLVVKEDRHGAKRVVSHTCRKASFVVVFNWLLQTSFCALEK